MKKIYLIIAFLTIVATGKSFAQNEPKTVNLNITLSDVMSLTVSTNSLNFVFDNETKYTNGITTPVTNHIEVLSSRNYRVDVNAGTITGGSALPADGVVLTASNGTDGNFAGVAAHAAVTLSASVVPLITSSQSSFNAAGSKTQFNLEYHVGANGKFAGLSPASNNVIPVVYTLVQP